MDYKTLKKKQYYEMIRLKFIVHGCYGITKHPSTDEDERNEMYRKYMELRNLYHECKGVIYDPDKKACDVDEE